MSIFYKKIFIFFVFLNASSLFAQAKKATKTPALDITSSIDSFLVSRQLRPFHGVVLISQGGKTVYSTARNAAEIGEKIKLKRNSQFVIGSLSKQITAVLVLREAEKGTLNLSKTVKTYLPTCAETWADSVRLYQLLNHTSGIAGFGKPLAFQAGSRFLYSGTAYGLLGQILEAVTKQSYTHLVQQLFKECGMNRSCAPVLGREKVVAAYSKQPDGTIRRETESFENNFTAAGLLISTADDLVRWNERLHGGKLLRDTSYRRMTTGSSVRNHPLFGEIPYGYGVQMDPRDGLYEIGHGGYVLGYVCINFYYPKTKTSLVVLESLDWKDASFKRSYLFETGIRALLRHVLIEKTQN